MKQFICILSISSVVSAGIIPAEISHQTVVNEHISAPIKYGLGPLTLTGAGIGGFGGYHSVTGVNHVGSVVQPGISDSTIATVGVNQHITNVGALEHHHSVDHGISTIATVGHILPAKAVVSHASEAYAIPAGYYGGLMTYPQVISNSVATKALKIPGIAIDSFKGYYGGYYPGTIGYGTSYRYFH